MDVMPNQVMRYLQLNEAGKALGAASIWLCASCTTCSVRCPRDRRGPAANQARKLCVERGNGLGSGGSLFNRLFVDLTRGGRVHELGVVMRYNAATQTR
jgi:heterodisulfide reductase subunit C